MSTVYLIGSLRNPKVPLVSSALRSAGLTVFDDWYAAGEIADDSWQAYEKARGRTYPEALDGYAADHVFSFDFHHLNLADIGVLVMPAGKSGHLELGYLIGRQRTSYVLFDNEPERWDVMYKLANGVYYDVEALVNAVKKEAAPRERATLPIVRPMWRRGLAGGANHPDWWTRSVRTSKPDNLP